MELRVSKWGNSLAMRIPSAIVRELELREGDKLQAHLLVDGSLQIRLSGWSRTAFAAELKAAQAQLAPGESVIEKLRGGARYSVSNNAQARSMASRRLPAGAALSSLPSTT